MLLYHALFASLASLLLQEITVALVLAPSQLGALESFSFVHRQHSADATYCIQHLGIYWFLPVRILRAHSVVFQSDNSVLIPQSLYDLAAVFKHDSI